MRRELHCLILRNKKGFTLYELMTVVFILSVLLVIAVPVYINVKENATAKACNANQRIIEGSINMWLEAEPLRSISQVQMSDLSPYWKNNPAPKCPLGTEYTLINGRVGCEHHEHF